MTTSLVPNDITAELTAFERIADSIADMSDECMCLTIAGIEDKSGYQTVHQARMKVRSQRVAIEKRRKELKAESLEIGRRIDAAAKRLTEMIAPIEAYLETQQRSIDAEKERLRQEAHEKKMAPRWERLDAIGEPYARPTVEAMSDAEFADFVETQVASAERRRTEEAAAKAEAERLATERAELERMRAEQEAERQQLEAERLRLQLQAEETRRAKELEEAKARAAEEAARRERERIERERQEAAEKEQRARAERERLARLAPDREKLSAFIAQIENMQLPSLSDKSLRESLERHHREFEHAVRQVLQKAE